MLMSFADPLSITIGGVTSSLPRTSVEGDKAIYTSGDGLVTVTSDHDYGKRTRRVLRVDTTKLSPDPFKPSENVKLAMSFYIVFDLPTAGFANADALAVYTGFKTLFSASSDAVIVKLLGGES
jgi:hypothetical protein